MLQWQGGKLWWNHPAVSWIRSINGSKVEGSSGGCCKNQGTKGFFFFFFSFTSTKEPWSLEEKVRIWCGAWKQTTHITAATSTWRSSDLYRFDIENESPWPLTLALGKRSPCKMLDLFQYWVLLEDQEARLPTGYDKWSKNRQRVLHQQNENPKFAVATWQFGNVSRYLAFYGSDNKSFPDSNTSDLVDRK